MLVSVLTASILPLVPGQGKGTIGVEVFVKAIFPPERHRTKYLQGLLARMADRIAAYTCGQRLNVQLGRPVRQLANLLV
jgi:hypothetical protein